MYRLGSAVSVPSRHQCRWLMSTRSTSVDRVGGFAAASACNSWIHHSTFGSLELSQSGEVPKRLISYDRNHLKIIGVPLPEETRLVHSQVFKMYSTDSYVGPKKRAGVPPPNLQDASKKIQSLQAKLSKVEGTLKARNTPTTSFPAASKVEQSVKADSGSSEMSADAAQKMNAPATAGGSPPASKPAAPSSGSCDQPPVPPASSGGSSTASDGSGSGGDGKGGGKLFAFMGITLGIGVGVFGYAAYDEDFRNMMAKKQYVGPAFEQMPEYIPFISKKELTQPVEGPKCPVPVKPLPIKPLKVEEEKTPEKKLLEEEERLCEADLRKKEAQEKVRREKACIVAEADVQNTTLEELLKTNMEECVSAVHSAVQAQKAGIQALQTYSTELRKAMDMTGQTEGVDGQWGTLPGFHKKKEQAIVEAKSCLTKAHKEIKILSATIDDGKQQAVTKKNKALGETEKTLANMKYELDSVVAAMEKAENDAKLIDKYRDLIQKGREQFKKELESITPTVKIGSTSGKMTEDDLNCLIAYAHRRMEQVQQQLARQQALEQKHITDAIAKKEEDMDQRTKDATARERELVVAEMEAEKSKWEAHARSQFEEELRQHLTRQAAAHSEHLSDVLKVQEQELESKFTLLLDERKMEERNKLYTEIGDYIARLRGIEAAVDARAEKEKELQKSQDLFLACQFLQQAIQKGKDPELEEWGEAQLKPLADELNAIKRAARNDPSIKTFLGAIPPEAASRGVWTLDGLQKRFENVSKMAKRVAMIPESGGTVFQYAMSYARCMFSFSGSGAVSDCTDETEVNLDDLHTYTILDMAGKLLQEGKLDSALRLMNQLKGQSRFVASDWIKEARLLLETQQAANVISAFASSRSLGNLE